MGEPHCERCAGLEPGVCTYAVVESRNYAWSLVQDSYSEAGRYWKERYEKLSKEYYRVQENASRQQLRADRLGSALHKAEKALSRYERPRKPKPDPRPWWRVGERWRRRS